jgi:hypothetical protein
MSSLKRSKWGMVVVCLVNVLYGNNRASSCLSDYEPGRELPSSIPAGYSLPARIDIEGYWDIKVIGSFLYWQGKEQGLGFAYAVPSNPTVQQGARIEKHFDYHPGFKVALGTDLHYDGWELYLDYSWLHTTETLSSDAPSWATGLEAVWLLDSASGGPSTASVTSASAAWKLKFDMMTLYLIRPSYLGRACVISPMAGFKGGWIRQNYRANYGVRNVGQVSATSSQTAQLLGPLLGAKGNILLGKGMYFNGELSSALLYENNTAKYKSQSATTPATALATNVKNKQRYFAPNVNLEMGFGWNSYLRNRRYFLDFNLCYDIQYLWDQNRMRSLKDATDEAVAGDIGDLEVHGITFTTALHF